ncbi:PA2169 family four-helix-bundle protein [Sphingomonas sp. MAH-20]|jgi:uncharacterized protein (TIGR02284 family)|uniref:PA2169 family four-helix-bundle protein n=1 Tax=Sphingomonas horti TaxID=2682842 RepID=A0A6I4IWX5_9SPHN|nr:MULTISPECIES: PA2169 family four-helix-bundle protein [Sphingomonas]MBA2920363.1 PA2169 family four-helix-bundle protein [Sphingomonas sp. CGMCC 1.13658]MVO76617.1 PA2169 family four-helix-bundle protein [Sphingomonas horti]
MIGSDKDISTLNSLIKTTIDSVNGYQESAEAVESERFRSMFRELAQDRQQVVPKLQAEVSRLGGNPEDDGSAAAAMHRGWVDLKSAITGRDDKAIINEVERGEDYIKEKFETAMNSGDLSPECRSVVQQCYESVRRGHDRVRDLKHALEGTH